MEYRDRGWMAPQMNYESGIAHELVPERHSTRRGYRATVCWAVGATRLRTDVRVDSVVCLQEQPSADGEEEVCTEEMRVTVCAVRFLTQSGWTPLVVLPTESLDPPAPDHDEFENYIRELERILIRDAMRVLDGWGVAK